MLCMIHTVNNCFSVLFIILLYIHEICWSRWNWCRVFLICPSWLSKFGTVRFLGFLRENSDIYKLSLSWQKEKSACLSWEEYASLKEFASSHQLSLLQHGVVQTSVPHLWQFFSLCLNYANILSSCHQMAHLFCCVVPWSKINILFIIIHQANLKSR